MSKPKGSPGRVETLDRLAMRVIRVALAISSSWATLVVLAIGAMTLGRTILKSSPFYL